MSDVVSSRTPTIRSFLRRYRDDILAEWRRVVQAVPDARVLPTPSALIDHIPEVIDEIAYIADGLGGHPSTIDTANRHALDRLGHGFDIASVVSELSILRGAILTIWARESPAGDISELAALNLAIDRAITTSVSRFAEMRERTLTGIDRVSMVTLEANDVDELLNRLLRVFKASTPSVDTVAVLLVTDGRLVGRAGVGLEAQHVRQLDMPIGEGFEGRVAAERAPIELRDAYRDPSVTNAIIRSRRVLALYGVPLIHEGRVIGVAHMGSLTAPEFSREDRQLFGSMTARATTGLVHQLLRQELLASELRSRRAVAEREHALAKLEALLAASPVGIGFIDQDLRIVRMNDALAALNNMPARDHIGLSVMDAYPEIASGIEPILRGVLATGEPVLNLELTRPSPANSAEHQWVLATLFPVRSESGSITGIGGVIIDVTATKRAQDALKTEQLQLESILDHAPALIWINDAEGRIVVANQRLAQALGRTVAELTGRRTTDLVPPEIAIAHQLHDRTVLAENRSIEVEEVVPSEAGPRTFLIIRFPIPGDPPLIGGIGTEITERKQMEEELRIALRTREELLAVVSHDLRGPLGSIQRGASLLLGQLEPDQLARRYLDVINRNCVRMGNLINDLLDSAKIRAGRLQLDLRRERAESLVSESLELQQSLADEKEVHLVRGGSIDGVELECDRGRILQVFGNLIGNAIKFCRAGDTITIAAERQGDQVAFSVADTGPGIDPAMLPKLFDAYWSGAEHAQEGTGLGLFIVRGIIERHGGRIWVETEPGAGTKFLFTLPITR